MVGNDALCGGDVKYFRCGHDSWQDHTDLYIPVKGVSGKTGVPAYFSSSSDKFPYFISKYK